MKPAKFNLHTPRSLTEALQAKAKLQGQGTLLAGGQSLVALMNFRVAQPTEIIALSNVTELKTITITDGQVRLGSGVTYSDVIAASTAGSLPRLFKEVLSNIASEPIRNKGTVGGAIAQADPSAEFPALCLALGAEIVVASTSGSRVVPVHTFFRGYMDTEAREDEVIVEIRFDRRLWSETNFGYSQVADRQGDYADAAVLLTYRTDAEDRMIAPVIVSMNLRSFPCRWSDLMEHLTGTRADQESVAGAVEDYFAAASAELARPEGTVVKSVLQEALGSAGRI
ncbi:FAD binding domain-containing protein [Georgenia thermotolerans]|uniref:FAD-binding PCMH-type domain-containing protein n=1 Tax=Georgenia thermotolerans TaxID=527326 RepID=A0A7J5UTT2_9MICO|nr:FAD binding domain-containing protein [Georgenia thermotolerans]KAE8765670.1 hypothetical protein GB883_02520 [Georgenia thermotolerans]